MGRIRRGGVAPLPTSAYVDPEPWVIPPAVADLETVPGRCFSSAVVTQCPQPAPGIVCTDCAMAELGEHWSNFKARTNSGTPKGVFYARLDREQSQPDPDFARALAKARAARAGG